MHKSYFSRVLCDSLLLFWWANWHALALHTVCISMFFTPHASHLLLSPLGCHAQAPLVPATSCSARAARAFSLNDMIPPPNLFSSPRLFVLHAEGTPSPAPSPPAFCCSACWPPPLPFRDSLPLQPQSCIPSHHTHDKSFPPPTQVMHAVMKP